jgi:alpha-L-arabinofuranosidase
MKWSGAPLVDGVAAKDPKTGAINVALVNYSPDSVQTVAIHAVGMGSKISSTGWRIDGPTLEALNIPGEPDEVEPVTIRSSIMLDHLELPAHSVTFIQIK